MSSSSQPHSSALDFPEIVNKPWIRSDHRALVTGGASGMGKAIALGLANKGAHVIVLDNDEQQLGSLKDHCPDIETIKVNLRNWNETKNIQ